MRMAKTATVARICLWAGPIAMLLLTLMQQPWMPGRKTFLGWSARRYADLPRQYGLLELKKYGAAAIPTIGKGLHSQFRCVRFDAVSALGDIGSPKALPLLFAALQDEETMVQAEAARSLARIGDRRAIPALLKALKNWKSYVRFEAALALVRFGNGAGVPELIRRLDNPRLGLLAEYALRQFTGQMFGINKAAWKSWYEQTQYALYVWAHSYAWPDRVVSVVFVASRPSLRGENSLDSPSTRFARSSGRKR